MILALTITGDVGAWERLGFTIRNGRAHVGMVELRFRQEDEAKIEDWRLGIDDRHENLEIDGLPTWLLPRVDGFVGGYPSASWASRIDHIVVMTPSIERTCGALTEVTGAPLKRIREVGTGVRQGFHRMGEVIVEVVERPDIPAETPARFWGLVFVVDDLKAVCHRLGPEIVTPPKVAVQRGRQIATVQATAGLGLPVALMSP